VRRGEVWWYEEPDEARHPILIVSRDEDVNRLFDVIAVPITTKIRGWDTEIELGRADGMDRDCVLSLHNTFLAHKAYATGYVTTLSSVRMTEVCRVLARATNC
jgi:mRNA-degrading endonuclease toxin of MazEF toxin-antitoxin module